MRRAFAVALSTVLVAMLLLAAPAASAAGRVGVANPDGAAVADPRFATTLTLTGSGFQSLKGGFGGIYVVFGTVSGTWQPSQGGVSGKNYRYVPDTQGKQNAGFQRFVAFPGSDTSGEANGGVIAANGTWRTTLTVPGAVFDTPQGRVDCTKVTCGVITFGAHGVVNGQNETFTPVRFESLAGSAPSTAPTPEAEAGATPEADATESAGPVAATPRVGKPRLTVDRATAVIGRVLSFNGRGFSPGEQVIATLDDGVASVGPLTAGSAGEVAGLLQLPADLSVGTHVLRLSGSVSGVETEMTFPIAPGQAAAVVQTTTLSPAAVTGEQGDQRATMFLAGAGIVAALAIGVTAVRIRRSGHVAGKSA